MDVLLGDAEAHRRGRLEVDLDEHGGLVADHPRVVAGRDVDDGRCVEVDDAAVVVLEVQRAVGEEADVGVLAALGADERAEVDGPAHAGRVDRPLDAGVADLGQVDLDGPERLVRRAGHRREERIAHRRTVARRVLGRVPMKVRIGVAVGGRGSLPIEQLGDVVDELDDLGFDSIWLPETFLTGSIDPLVGLAYAAARVRRLKLGTHLVTPGRNPYALAKALAQLDRLSDGRLLLTFVAGVERPGRAGGPGTARR